MLGLALCQSVPAVGGTPIIGANLIASPQDFSSGSWTKQNSTVTANNAVAPDGTLTADTVSFVSVASITRIYQDTATLAANGTAYAGAIWMRSASPCSIDFRIERGGPADTEFVTCAVTTTWKRFALRHSTTWTGTNAIRFILISGVASFTADIEAWQADLEVAP